MNKYIEPIDKWLEEKGKDWWSDESEFWVLQYDIVDKMKAEKIEKESVEPILQLMEKYPLVEFGTPGALTHFIESFAKEDFEWYENLIVQSVKRKPTVHTVWLLNRVINVSTEEVKEEYIQIMKDVYNNENIHKEIKAVSKNFLENQEELE